MTLKENKTLGVKFFAFDTNMKSQYRKSESKNLKTL